ncbi:hypothetical protein MDA_GLEAN10010356 [Myotis davidii]|uniref:Uncharacterized protein n=1 Tax=Myotis davidii TaxID=225400 RepID=L5M3L4_MYODS|nr:hypothetical protein MDA_GLEAN10010356 [Myotis davidii]
MWELEGRLGKNEAQRIGRVRSVGGEHAGSPESAHHPRLSQQALLKVPTRTVLVPEASGAGMSRKDSNA